MSMVTQAHKNQRPNRIHLPEPGSGPPTKWVLPVLLMGLFITNVVLSYATLLITGARLGDIYGYRRLFISGLGLFTLASLAPSILV